MNCLVCAVVELLNNVATYDKKPLCVAVCYRCGHMLWSCVDGAHTFFVSKPSGMSEEEAPASAYLRAVPVWQDLCTLRGVSQPRTLSTLLPSQHTHTHTITSTCTHTQWSYSTLQVYNYRYGTYQNSNVEQHFSVAFFFCLVCGCF